MVQHLANKLPAGRLNPGRRDRLIADSTDKPLSPFLYFTLVQILLTTNFDLPPPAPPPPKMVSNLRGIEASKSKNPLGDRFVGKTNDFTRDWTSVQYHALGYATRMTPQKGGCMASTSALDLATSL